MADRAHEETDDLISQLERKVQETYGQAMMELLDKQKDALEKYESLRVEKMAAVEAGEMTMAEYREWAKKGIVGTRWLQAMVKQMAQGLVNADKIAMSIVNGHTPEAYALNHNFGAWQVESGAGVDTAFTLYDAQTVERLIREDPELLPRAEVDVEKDLRWNTQKISSAITQSILQGESLPEVARRLQGVADMDYRAAMRTARTAMTSAQNAGRVDSYKRAEKMGIKLKQEWMATLDGRTRHSHRRLDGERVDVGKKFSNGCRYPGDPAGKPAEVYNCRCTLVAAIEGIDTSDAPRISRLKGISYDEWKAGKDG